MELDKLELDKILRTINADNDTTDAKFHRLGIFNPSRARPIKVCLNDEKIVYNYLRKSNILRNTRTLKNIYISSDRTPRQREQYRNVKNELRRRQEAGETNIKIKYVKSVPKIVTLN